MTHATTFSLDNLTNVFRFVSNFKNYLQINFKIKMKRAKIEVKVNGKVSLLKIIQTIYRMECDPSFLKFVKTDLSLAKKKRGGLLYGSTWIA